MTTDQLIEAILFASAKSCRVKFLMDVLEKSKDEIIAGCSALRKRLEASTSGLLLVEHEGAYELVTRPEASDIVSKVVHAEIQGELTRAQLETLTVLAYRGPMTRAEIEQIRGVQCSLILRNLQLRGLAEQTNEIKLGQPVFSVTAEFIKYIGLGNVSQLPEFETIRGNASVEAMLQELESEAGV